MENQGRPGFSVEGLWEGTPREERVTARARAWGGPPRTLGKGWSPGDCGWERASAVDFGPDGDGRPSEATALFSVFRVNRSPTLTETTHTGRITDSAPDGSQEAIGLGCLPGARAASPRPRRRHHPPESAAGPEDLRARGHALLREDASALSAQNRAALRRHLGGPATHRSEGPRNDSQCAISVRIGRTRLGLCLRASMAAWPLVLAHGEPTPGPPPHQPVWEAGHGTPGRAVGAAS